MPSNHSMNEQNDSLDNINREIEETLGRVTRLTKFVVKLSRRELSAGIGLTSTSIIAILGCEYEGLLALAPFLVPFSATLGAFIGSAIGFGSELSPKEIILQLNQQREQEIQNLKRRRREVGDAYLGSLYMELIDQKITALGLAEPRTLMIYFDIRKRTRARDADQFRIGPSLAELEDAFKRMKDVPSFSRNDGDSKPYMIEQKSSS